MCYPTKCADCAKTTWAGCGQHIDMVRVNIPAEQWCPGHEKAQKPRVSFFAKFFPAPLMAEQPERADGAQRVA
jgi:hypothetical protein